MTASYPHDSRIYVNTAPVSNGGNGAKASHTTREMIGRSGLDNRNAYWRYRSAYSIDRTITDYVFWDKLRRGQAWGYRLGGLFAQPIAEIIASWTLGGGVQAKLAEGVQATEQDIEQTNRLLARFCDRIQGLLFNAVIDNYCLGDMYIVVNPDGSLAVPSPDTVDVTYDPRDYRRPVRVKITTRTPGAYIQDTYTDDKRIVDIQYYEMSDAYQRHTTGHVVKEYDNLIGRIPVVHFANDRGSNEVYGRPIYEALLYLFERYDDLLTKALDGAEIMGNPIPAFENLKDVNATVAANTEPANEEFLEDYEVPAGERRVPWDTLSALWMGEGGTFNFKHPGVGFTDDIRQMLRQLLMQVLYKTRIPEVVWGAEVGNSLASSLEQMKTFYTYIEGRRIALEGDGADNELDFEPSGGLLAVFDLWLRTQKLIHGRRVIVAPVVMRWPELSSVDQRLQFDWTQWLYDKQLITSVEALSQSQIVESPAEEIDAARREFGIQPTPSPTSAPAVQPAPVTEAEGGQPLVVGLNLPNNQDLMSLQPRLKELYPQSGIEWINPADYQIVLLRAQNVTEDKATAFAAQLKGLPLPTDLNPGSLYTQDDMGRHDLHFRIRRNVSLLDLQAKVYGIAQRLGIATDTPSIPERYTPKLIVAHLPERARLQTYDAKFTVAPDGMYATWGGDSLLNTGEGEAPSIEDVETVAQMSAVRAYTRAIRECIADRATLINAATQHNQRIAIAEALSSTRARFEAELERQFMSAYNEKIKRGAFISRMMTMLTRYARLAYADGYSDAGSEIDLNDTEDEEAADANRWLDAFVSEQRQYVENIAGVLYADDEITVDEIKGQKPTLWWNGSVYGSYAHALIEASGNARLKWVWRPEATHCPSCVALNGIVLTAKRWKSEGVEPKSRRLKCKMGCRCDLEPTNEKKYRGRLPRYEFAEMIDEHDHVHV